MKGFLSWIGGKHYLAKQIVPILNGRPHRYYCEPFMGGAHVFFRREAAHVEVLNDINRDLVTLFRVLQYHLEEFLRYFKWALVSRDEFYRLDKVPPDTLTDIQRVARFYYLQKLSFAGKLTHRSFQTASNSKPRLNLLRIEEELSQVHLRLARVQIENLPWRECIERYDKPQTLFYLDPPYYGVEHYYGAGIFARKEFEEIAQVLEGLKGEFLMSLNDTPKVRSIFGQFHLRQVETRYPTGSQSSMHLEAAKELLISSWPTNPQKGRRPVSENPKRGAHGRVGSAQNG